MMSTEDAQWVRDVAWRKYHREEHAEVPTLSSTCRCHPAPCGYCAFGRHRDCTHETHQPHESCAAYITNRRGGVVAQVWEAGHRHVWECQCKRTGHDGWTEQQQTLAAAEAAHPTQLSLF